MPLGNLLVSVRATANEWSVDLKKIQRETKELERSIKPFKDVAANVGKAMSVGLTVPLLAIGAAAFASASKINDAMDTIRQSTGATGDALEGLGRDFRTVLGQVPDSAADASTAISELSKRTGLAGKPLQDLSVQMLNLARMTKTGVGDAVASTTRVFGDWGIATDKQSDSLDFLFKVSQQTGIQFGQLSKAVVQFGAPLRQMGFDFETSAALLGKFEKEGVNAELVMGSLRIALTKLAAAGVKDAKAGLVELSKQIKNAGTDAQATTLAVKAFGAKAGPDMAAAIREGRFSVDDLVASLKNSSDTINKAAKDTEGFSEKLATLKNKAELALEPLGVRMMASLEKLMPTIVRVLELVAKLTEGFANLSPSTQTTVLAMGGLLAAAGPVITIFTKLSGTITGLITWFGKIPAALTAAKAAMVTFGGSVAALGTALTGATGAAALFAGGLAIGAILAAAVAVYKLVDGYLAMRDAKKNLQQTLDAELTAQQRLVKEFEKHNITVDQSRIGDAKYLANLSAMRQQQIEAGKAAAGHATAIKETGAASKGTASDIAAVNKMLTETDTKAKQAADKIKALNASFIESLKPADDLQKTLSQLTGQFATQENILKVYGPQIIETVEAQKAMGTQVSKLMANFYALAKAEQNAIGVDKELQDLLNERSARMAKWNETLENSKVGAAEWSVEIDRSTQANLDGVMALGKMRGSVEETAAKVKAMKDVGYSARAIYLALGNEMENAADTARKLGTQLDPLTAKILKQEQAAQKLQKRADDLGNAWGASFAGISRGLATMVGNFDFKMKSLVDIFKNAAKSMLTSFMDGLLNPLTEALGGIGKSLADGLSNLAFGKGKGGLGGVLSGLPGIGSLLGGAGAAATTAAGLTATAAGTIAVPGILGGIAAPSIAAPVFGGTAAGGGLGASMAALATNPITIAAAAAIAGGLIINSQVGQGRKTASRFTDTIQNPFATTGNDNFKGLSKILAPLDAARVAGTLTITQLKTAQAALEADFAKFKELSAGFVSSKAGFGGNEQKVVDQAFSTIDPLVMKLREDLAKEISELSGVTGTGGASGAKITAPFNPVTNITINLNGTTITTVQVRDKIIPEITTALETNVRGYREKWAQLLDIQSPGTPVPVGI